MARGRKPKSKLEKDLHGTSRKDRESQNETLPVSSGKLGLPRGLSKTVQRHCSGIAKYLKDSGVPIDLIRPLFERYCKHLQVSSAGHKASTRERLAKEGVLEHIRAQSAGAKQFREHSDIALKIEKQFESILKGSKLPKDEKKDPLKEFQAKGKKLEAVK